MQRRHFISRLAQALAALGAAPAIARDASATRLPAHVDTELHLQDCRIAGSHYYGCHAVLGHLRTGDLLQLRRQPDNPHDPRAIEVLWCEHKLGYLPRLDNAAAASLIDRSHALRAQIIGVEDPKNEWEPVRLRAWIHVHDNRHRA